MEKALKINLKLSINKRRVDLYEELVNLIEENIDKSETNNTTEKDNACSSERNTESNIYPSATIMLEISKSEYDKERERTNNLDNKASFFMSAIIAIITIYIPIIPFKHIKKIYMGSGKELIVLVTICICILVVAFITLIIAFYNLYKSFSLKPFKRVDFENLSNEQILLQNKSLVERGLLDHYHTILVNNADINNDKASKLTTGIKYSIICFSLISLATIGLLIII